LKYNKQYYSSRVGVPQFEGLGPKSHEKGKLQQGVLLTILLMMRKKGKKRIETGTHVMKVMAALATLLLFQ
jgi:hypothetical protein